MSNKEKNSKSIISDEDLGIITGGEEDSVQVDVREAVNNLRPAYALTRSTSGGLQQAADMPQNNVLRKYQAPKAK
jgi:hypothetical protein